MCHRWDSKPAGRQPVGQEDRWTCDAERSRGSALSWPSARSRSGPARAAGVAAAGGGGGGTVNLAMNPWVGYEADAAVVGYVEKTQLGETVTKKNLKEEISWQGFETGDVDVILENWGHDDLTKTYIDQNKSP